MDVLKYDHDSNDKTAVIANKNVAMLLKKSVNVNLLQIIEETAAHETYKDLVEMAPDRNAIIRSILAEVPLVCAADIEAYVVEHQRIHSRLMKADPKGTTEDSTHQAHMTKLLDGLSNNQTSSVNYLVEK